MRRRDSAPERETPVPDSELSAYDWLLFGVEGKPESSVFRDAAHLLGRAEVNPKEVGRRWSAVLDVGTRPKPASSVHPMVQSEPPAAHAPRLLRRLASFASTRLIHVGHKDHRRLVVLAGEELTPALEIRCDFDVQDVFATQDERLFVMERAASPCVHELDLSERRIGMAEEIDRKSVV